MRLDSLDKPPIVSNTQADRKLPKGPVSEQAQGMVRALNLNPEDSNSTDPRTKEEKLGHIISILEKAKERSKKNKSGSEDRKGRALKTYRKMAEKEEKLKGEHCDKQG